LPISRRTLIAASAGLPFAGSAHAATAVNISVDAARGLGAIAPDFMGLGFEISSVAVPGLLAAKNASYVQLVRNLGKRGVIRIGGNTSDYSTYSANGASVSAPKASVITQANLIELRSFLDAIGWKLIWGLNLGSDKLDNAVEEARAVASVMGDRLIAFQVGNEPDLFGRAGHRPANYGYNDWLQDYRRTKAAVRAVVPGAPFAGPDLAGDAGWMTRFARDEGTDAVLLTAHHYITGQDNPAATQTLLLAQERKYIGSLATFREASKTAGKPWRMSETASFYGGGKDGVSNTFAAALWALDYLFVLMNYGCSGVNMETGVNHLGRISYYTPINDDRNGHYGAAPEYYGLLAFAQVAQGERVAVDVAANGVNLTAYGVKNASGLALAVINKDAMQDATLSLQAGRFAKGRMIRLTGPALDARDGITLGGAGVGSDGGWTGASEPLRITNGNAALPVSRGSAALVWLS
jgi:hypothetical protein